MQKYSNSRLEMDYTVIHDFTVIIKVDQSGYGYSSFSCSMHGCIFLSSVVKLILFFIGIKEVRGGQNYQLSEKSLVSALHTNEATEIET